MGLQLGDLVPREAIDFGDLKGKVIAIDAFNAIYQFLTSIRQPDGTPLMDKERRITSHLSGLFYRNVALLSEGMKKSFNTTFCPLFELLSFIGCGIDLSIG